MTSQEKIKGAYLKINGWMNKWKLQKVIGFRGIPICFEYFWSEHIFGSVAENAKCKKLMTKIEGSHIPQPLTLDVGDNKFEWLNTPSLAPNFGDGNVQLLNMPP